MKISAVSAVIESFAEALSHSGDKAMSAALRAVISLFAGRENKSLADFFKLVESVSSIRKDESRPKLGEAAPGLKNLLKIVQAVGKPPLVADLNSLVEFLEKHKADSIEELRSAISQPTASTRKKAATKPVGPLNEDLVDAYVRRLKETLGNDPAFMEVYQELKANKKVTRIEAVAIASRFVAPIAPSASRPKALEVAYYRHRRLEDFKIKSAAIGRHAA